MTDAEKFVREKYPTAFVNLIHVNPNVYSIEQEWCSAYPDLGRGATKIAAWADAANRIEKAIIYFGKEEDAK